MTVQYIRSSSGELSFDVHQHFHAVTSPASTLRYAIVPTGGKQARFAGRVAVKPLIDLSVYRQKAVIDWLEIKVFLRDKTQGRHIHDLISKETGVSVYAKPLATGADEESGAAGKRVSATTDTFAIRVQDPTPVLVDRIMDILETRWGSVSEPFMHGMEVSIDWYSKAASVEELCAMTGVLQRHFVPYRLNPAHEGARPRSIFGKIVGGTGKTLRHVRHLYDPSLDLYQSPMVDGTLYFGARDASVLWKVMMKVTDQRTGEGHRQLPVEEHRARIEVTLQESVLRELGIDTLRSLDDFSFETLKKDFFGFWVPTIPGVVSAKGTAAPMVVGYRHLSIFQRSGAYQFMHWERGYVMQGIDTSIRNGHLRSDPRVLRQRRLLKQDHMFMLAYDELNRQVENALRLLRWSRR